MTVTKKSSSSSKAPAKKSKAVQKIEPPKEVVTAFVFFGRTTRDEIKAAHPDWSLGDVGRELSKRWKALKKDAKRSFRDLAAADKKRFDAEKEAYDETPEAKAADKEAAERAISDAKRDLQKQEKKDAPRSKKRYRPPAHRYEDDPDYEEPDYEEAPRAKKPRKKATAKKAPAERDAKKAKTAAERRDAKLAAFAAAYAKAVADDTPAPDLSLLTVAAGRAFRTGFLAYAVVRYADRPRYNREEYVIKVDVRAESKCQRRLTYWLISTQVDSVGNDLAGEMPSPKDDALYRLDKAYADAGVRGGYIFNKRYEHNGIWEAVLYKDRSLRGKNRAAAVVAHYKEWLPPWKRS